MTIWTFALLLVGGVFAGGINAMAGGGSILTVPLLVVAGVPGAAANGSNRVGVLTSNLSSAAAFRRLGVDGLGHVAPILVPVIGGSLVGSIGISRLADDQFETAFGLLMIPLIILSLKKPKVDTQRPPWTRTTTVVVFFAIGIYGGAFQAGVGLVLLAALGRAGYDLVTANHIKVIITLTVTAIALPVFIAAGQIRWVPALVLAVGFSLGGWFGARLAVAGGDRLIRGVMFVCALVLAGRLLGLY